ncbi:MAG: anti-sigma factor [Woeseia sp.]
MNYSNPTLLSLLAERFVTGTMSRRARRRFSRLLHESEAAATRVYALEADLSPLAWSLAPVNPSELVWQRIARQAGFGSQNRSRPATAPRLSTWSGLALAMSMAVVVTSVGWWQAAIKTPEVVVETIVETVPAEPAIGVVADGDGNSLWVARIYPDLQRADVAVSNMPEQHTMNDYELWILRDDGIPVSLGLLPQSGDSSLTLSVNAIDALGRGSTLAVSLEPLGGSPMPTPSGPVLYTAAMYSP